MVARKQKKKLKRKATVNIETKKYPKDRNRKTSQITQIREWKLRKVLRNGKYNYDYSTPGGEIQGTYIR